MEWVRRIFPTAILLPREYYGGVLQPQMQKLCIMSKSTANVKKSTFCLLFICQAWSNPWKDLGFLEKIVALSTLAWVYNTSSKYL